ERNWIQKLDAESGQVSCVAVIRGLKTHWDGPWGKRGPSMTDERDPAELGANRFDRTKDSVHGVPAEFAVPDIDHAEFFGRAVERSGPCRVVRIEQEGADA